MKGNPVGALKSRTNGNYNKIVILKVNSRKLPDIVYNAYTCICFSSRSIM